MSETPTSGTKNEHKPKLSSPDIFRWGGCLPRARVGAKKFGMSLETREIKFFGRDIPGFCWDIPAAPEKFEKKKFVFNFRPLQPPQLLKKVSQYTSHLYCSAPPICIAVLLVPLGYKERQILSVLRPFVSQYTSHLYCDTPVSRYFERMLVVVVTGMFPTVSYQVDVTHEPLPRKHQKSPSVQPGVLLEA